ncbi:MAG TPA: hypothetical protein DCY53_05535 [Desulfobacteraceae bacterium]|nr:hypothetical protein [Desulfobacteraceae bacterium]
MCEAFICKAFKEAAIVSDCMPFITKQMGVSDTPMVKIFEKLKKHVFDTNCHPTTRGKIVNNKQFLSPLTNPL